MESTSTLRNLRATVLQHRLLQHCSRQYSSLPSALCRAGSGLLLLALLLGPTATAQAVDPAVLAAEQQRITVVSQVTPAVVAIFSAGGQGGGSGVLISPDGYALSNFHVTSGAGDFMKCGLPDGRLYDGIIVGIDPTGDVALLKLFGRDDFPHARLGDSDQLSVGDWAFAMGNPFLLATDFSPTVTYGIVSGVHRYQYPAGTILEYADCIQVDASINPGNSGGPLFNSMGELVGINGRGSFEKRGRVNSGAGYAISINQIKHFLDRLRSGRIVDHATLGATVTTRDDGAVVVSNILEESECYRRGLRIDDEIVTFAGRPIRSVNQFKNVLGIYPKGWQLPLVFRRDGAKQEIVVRLRALHHRSEFLGKAKPEQPKPEQPRKPGDRPAPPDPERPRNPHQAKSPPPAALVKFFEKKPGYANYYFNRQEQQRVLKAIEDLGDFSTLQGNWKITGKFGPESPFELTLADKGGGLVVNNGQQTFFQAFNSESDLEDEPPGTGGLLVALHHWRLLLTRGPQAFSDFYYLGTEPLDGTGPTVDVLVAELSGARSHWYFNPGDGGKPVGFDLFRAEDLDPCEIRWEGFAEFDGRQLPRQATIRHAGLLYAKPDFHSYKWSPKPEPEPEAPAVTPASTGAKPSGKP